MGGDARPKLRLTPRSVLVAIGMFGLTLAALGMVAASRRVIGWILVAATLAGLLHPLVTRLQGPLRRRGVAVLLVMATVVGGTAAVIYGLVDDVQRETRRLQQAAPERAHDLEQSERFGKLARDFKLEERTKQFVDNVPERLRGGTPADALRAAGSRGVAFLATTVLTIFFLFHGPKLARSGLAQMRDDDRRARARALFVAVYGRAFGYASAALVQAVAAGLFGFALARAADVPGAAPLGIWLGLWDLVPLAGAVVGALPIVLLAAVVSGAKATALTLAFLAYQLVENMLVNRPVQRATVRVGPFLTLAAGLVGLELSGVAGALLGMLAVTVAVAAADEIPATLKLFRPGSVETG